MLTNYRVVSEISKYSHIVNSTEICQVVLIHPLSRSLFDYLKIADEELDATLVVKAIDLRSVGNLELHIALVDFLLPIHYPHKT